MRRSKRQWISISGSAIPLLHCAISTESAGAQEVEPLLTRLGDKARSARIHAFRCNHHFLAGEHARAIEFGEAGLKLAEECNDKAVTGELLYRIGQSYHSLGDNRRSIELLEKSLAFTSEQRENDRFELSVMPAVVNRTWLVSALTECGNFKTAMTHAKRALQIAEQTEHPLSEALGWLAEGHVLRRKGELDGAIGALERGISVSDRYAPAMWMWRLRLLSSLGVAYAVYGNHKVGLQHATEALDGAEQMGLIVDLPMFQVHLGQIYMLAGNAEDAARCARQALQLRSGDRGTSDEAWARHLISCASYMSHPNEIDETIAELQSALQLAIDSAPDRSAAHCQAELGWLYFVRGDEVAARDTMATANAVYTELDMRPLTLVGSSRLTQQAR